MARSIDVDYYRYWLMRCETLEELEKLMDAAKADPAISVEDYLGLTLFVDREVLVDIW